MVGKLLREIFAKADEEKRKKQGLQPFKRNFTISSDGQHVGIWKTRNIFTVQKKSVNDIMKASLVGGGTEELKRFKKVLAGLLIDLIEKYISKNNDSISKYFSGAALEKFVDDYIEQSYNASKEFGSFLKKVADLSIFFRHSSWNDNTYQITDITGRLNQGEAGEFLRSRIVQGMINS